jgi:hypothetical protein
VGRASAAGTAKTDAIVEMLQWASKCNAPPNNNERTPPRPCSRKKKEKKEKEKKEKEKKEEKKRKNEEK